jgi:NDP-sugar pyrophosphorylase family protein
MGVFIHESSYVDDGAVIGDGTKVWHFCHVMGGAVIGERCSLGQNVVVMPGTRIGNNVKIQNNVSIYEGVELEDDVFCGPSMVFTNVINPRATSRASTSTSVRSSAAVRRSGERDGGVRRDARRVCVRWRRRGRHERREIVRPRDRSACSASWMDVSLWRTTRDWGRGPGTGVVCGACGTRYSLQDDELKLAEAP